MNSLGTCLKGEIQDPLELAQAKSSESETITFSYSTREFGLDKSTEQKDQEKSTQCVAEDLIKIQIL